MKKNKEYSDLYLINRVKNNDSKCLNKLVFKYGGIYDSIINKFNFSKSFIKQDLLDDKPLFFFNVAKKYNPKKKTKFSTYLYNMAKWTCLDRLKKDRKNNEFTSFGDENFDFSSVDAIINKIKTFDERTQYIFMHRFFNPDRKTSFGEIGKELNLTYEGVRQIYKKHIEILKKTNEQN